MSGYCLATDYADLMRLEKLHAFCQPLRGLIGTAGVSYNRGPRPIPLHALPRELRFKSCVGAHGSSANWRGTLERLQRLAFQVPTRFDVKAAKEI